MHFLFTKKKKKSLTNRDGKKFSFFRSFLLFIILFIVHEKNTFGWLNRILCFRRRELPWCRVTVCANQCLFYYGFLSFLRVCLFDVSAHWCCFILFQADTPIHFPFGFSFRMKAFLQLACAHIEHVKSTSLCVQCEWRNNEQEFSMNHFFSFKYYYICLGLDLFSFYNIISVDIDKNQFLFIKWLNGKLNAQWCMMNQ